MRGEEGNFSRVGNTGDFGLSWPLLICAATVIIALALLHYPVSVPIGPNYWDLPIYLDGAHRIALGQVPAVDFDTPVGALGYYLTYLGMKLFPNAHPVLLTQWMTLVITVPVMVAVLASPDAQRPYVTAALVLPFLVFQFLPFNIQAYTTFPGVDGYGIYNRHVSIVLYVLVAALVFLRSDALRAAIVFWCLTALFFLKVTGFAAGGIICAFALLAGRLKLVHSITAAASFVTVLAAVEYLQGSVSAYIADILELASLNSGTLLPRFLTVASVRFDVIFATVVLIAYLAWIEGKELWRPFLNGRLSLARVLDKPLMWLAIVLGAGILFETQNTGSQELIFLWPILLGLLIVTFGTVSVHFPAHRLIIALLVAAIALPSLTKVLHRAARAVVVLPRYVALEAPELGALGRVVTKPEILERAETMGDHYARHSAAYRDLTRRGQLPAWTYYSEIAMQATWLIELNRAAEALLAYESKNELRFESVYVLDFTSPLAWSLGRRSPRYVQIGLDAYRTMGPLSAEAQEAINNTAAILQPLCPITGSRNEIALQIVPFLRRHERVQIDRCWLLHARK